MTLSATVINENGNDLLDLSNQCDVLAIEPGGDKKALIDHWCWWLIDAGDKLWHFGDKIDDEFIC